VLHRRQQRPLARRRLQFLMLLKSGKCSSQAEAGALIGLKARASEKLWKLYVGEGVERLVRPRGGGRPAKLTEEAKADLQSQLDESQIATLKQACRFVEQTHGIVLTQQTMHYYFKQVKIKKKTGRPTNVRKDVAGEEQFKKKSFPS
jgi:transposase